jgi:hypothetical protein
VDPLLEGIKQLLVKKENKRRDKETSSRHIQRDLERRNHKVFLPASRSEGYH